MKFYKIRHKQTGLFSNKAYEFKKIGSFWMNKKDLQHDLKMLSILCPDDFVRDYLSNIEIVEFETFEVQTLSVEQL